MGLLDVLNGMQNGPRGPSTPSAQSEGGGMSPMTMAILALLAWKAVKHFGGSQPGAAPAHPRNRPATSRQPARRRWAEASAICSRAASVACSRAAPPAA